MFPSKAQESKLGDLLIRILENECSKKIHLKKSLVITISSDSSFFDLKKKISGSIDIKLEQIVLVYKGSICLDKDIIGSDLFENNDIDRNEDTIIFRPRIFLYLNNPEEIDDSNDSNDDSHDMNNMALFSDPSVSNSSRPQSSLVHRRHTKKNKKERFNLQNELLHINCQDYYESLLHSGFDNEGAFASLTEEDLLNPDNHLWIPSRARQRILSLAETLSRKLAIEDEEFAITELEKVEKEMIANKNMHAFSLSGVDLPQSQATTKTDINRLWKKIQIFDLTAKKNENIEEDEDTKSVRSKHLNPSTLRKISKLQRYCELMDDNDIFTKDQEAEEIFDSKEYQEYVKIRNNFNLSQNYCCEDHKKIIQKSHQRYLEELQLTIKFEAIFYFEKFEKFELGIIPKIFLEKIASQKLSDIGENLKDHPQVEAMFNECILSLEKQNRIGKIISPHEVIDQNLLTPLPTFWLDGLKFADMLSEYIRGIVEKKI